MKKKRETQKGITLIALIITIIVLLILAAITINLLFGNESVLERGKQAKFETDFRSVQEAVELYKSNKEIENLLGNSIEKLPVMTEVTQEEKVAVESLKQKVEQIRGKEMSQIHLYWIDLGILNLKMSNRYVIDKETEQIYNYEGQKFFKQAHHTIGEEVKTKEFIKDPTPGDISDLKIYSIEDLVLFSNSVNGGNDYIGKTVTLMNDLDFKEPKCYNNPETTEFGDVNKDSIIEGLLIELGKEKGFTPVGGGQNNGKYFKGTFEGNQNTIKNLYQKANIYYLNGLFGGIYDATIQNLTMENVNLSVSSCSGSIVATAEGTITLINCMNKGGNIQNASRSAGGLIGETNAISLMSNCHNNGAVNGGAYTGGLIGRVKGDINKIENCSNVADLNSSHAGGLIGYVEGSKIISIEKSYNKGNITGTASVGGLIGTVYNSTIIETITECYNEGTILAKDSASLVGGLIGNCKAINTITKCYNKGNVTVEYSSGFSGGLLSMPNVKVISDCYNTGEIKGSVAGGILAFNGQSSVELINLKNYGKIQGEDRVAGIIADVYSVSKLDNCGNEGEVIGYDTVGGVLGRGGSIGGDITNCYNTANVTGEGNVAGIVAQMTNDSTTKILNCYNTGNIVDNVSGYRLGGLFASIDKAALVENCYNTGNVTGIEKDYVGGIVGFTSDTITQIKGCYNTGKIEGGEISVGGIAGFVSRNGSNIENCYNKGEIIGSQNVGGLFGKIDGLAINTSYNTGKLTEKGAIIEGVENSVGGIVGSILREGSNIENCYNKGEIIGSQNVGGLFGTIAGPTISTSYNTGKITQTGANSSIAVGGIIGKTYSPKKLETCYNAGEIYGTNNVGGILGLVQGGSVTISKIYNTNRITGNGQITGGLIGESQTTLTIDKGYNLGDVTGSESGYTGGIVGKTTTATIKNTYITSNVTKGQYVGFVIGYGNARSNIKNTYYSNTGSSMGYDIAAGYSVDESKQKNLDQMKTDEFATILNNGEDAWKRDSATNNGLPSFK